MARARRTTTKTDGAGPAGGGEFTCPECGKTFTLAASLGAHRQRAHGISGASKRASARRATAKRRPRRQRTQSKAAGSSGTSTRERSATVDRDQLLQALFPNGVPPREDVINQLSSWLDEAERLATL